MAYKNKEKRKAWREANKEKIAATGKAWREDNKDRHKALMNAWYEDNKEKKAATNKTYREANKEKIAAITKAWYEDNKERKAAYYEANKEKITATNKTYREANKEKITAWYEANPDKIAAYSSRRRALKLKLIPKHLKKCPVEKQRVLDIHKLCVLISKVTGVRHHVDHMWPLSDGGPHWSGNLQIITARENMTKHASVDLEVKHNIQQALNETVADKFQVA
jgi:hypothetical protein